MEFSFHHTALSVSDMESTVEFYSYFGFREVASYSSQDFTVKHLKLGDFILELFWFREHTKTEPLPLWDDLKINGYRHIALRVEDIYAILDMLKKDGYADRDTTIQRGKTGILYFFIRDPDGNFVEIVQDDREL
ncbi:VOC family protein [Persephonella sp.]|nr:VOC family protein [Aquificota bacterium]